MKTCTVCSKDLEDNLFGKNRKICKECAYHKYHKKTCDICGFLIANSSKSCKKCKQNIKEKKCNFCKQILPIDNFGRRLNKFRSNCKFCESKMSLEYRKNNIEKIKKYKKTYKNPKSTKLTSIRVKLRRDCKNLTEKEIKDLTYKIYEQTKCDCCGVEFKNSKDKNIDHCHLELKYRGTICFSCNHVLGHSKDSIDKLRYCIKFLEKTQGTEL